MYSKTEECRICSSRNLEKYLDLGNVPLANCLVKEGKEEDERFPLEVVFCSKCKLSQLSVVVDPRKMFTDYPYRTSISSTFQKHFEKMAESFAELFPDTGNTLVLDIASNDGCALQQFKKKGFKVLGVEPSENLAEFAEKQGIPTIALYWGKEAAEKVLEKGKPKIVIATNVFAHVNDVKAFIENVKKVLYEEGMFVIEVPHALNLVVKNEFDTIYHEHLSYFLVKPLVELFKQEGMEVFDVQNVPVHGGSIRVFAKMPENKRFEVNEKRIEDFLKAEEEKGLYEIGRYEKFSEEVEKTKKGFKEMLEKFKKEGKKVAGFGAAAKASTLMHSAGIGKDLIAFIIDDSPDKQNKCFSGNRVPILPFSVLEKEKPDVLVLFAWTIAKELMHKTPEHRKRNGKYVIPMPFPKIVSSENEL